MAAKQAVQVHRGISYDLEVDTTTEPPHAVARAIQGYLDLPLRPH
jgi:chloramphenicol 3-O-phosphotransferase